MFDVDVYADKNGNSEIKNYLLKLEKSKSKDSRIKLSKITAHIRALEKEGTRIGVPVTKHLKGKIWELRPLRDRILYFFYNEEAQKFVLLSHFIKKTNKTPPYEIEKAEKLMMDYIERVNKDEQEK